MKVKKNSSQVFEGSFEKERSNTSKKLMAEKRAKQG